jgi:hypothetical protein
MSMFENLGWTPTSKSRHKAFKTALAIALAVSTAMTTLVAGTPAQAANDRATHLDENFDVDGFANFATTADVVRVVGTLTAPFDGAQRKITVSIEGSSDASTHKAILRAYVPGTASGSFNGWSNPTNASSPVQDFVADTTFGVGGVLEILNPAGTAAITGVTSVLLKSRRALNTQTSATVVPWLAVTAGSSTYLVKLDGTRSASGGLLVCTTACTQTSVDATTAIQSVAGAGSVVSGFSLNQFGDASLVYVSGVKLNAEPFIAKLSGNSGELGDSAGDRNSYQVIPTADWAPTGSYSAFTSFVPVENGLIFESNTLFLAGNIFDGSKSVGVLLRRSTSGGEELRAHATSPATYFNVGADSTIVSFMTDPAALGGSYKDTSGGVTKPLMLASADEFAATYSSYKLAVDSVSNERLLATQHGNNNKPIGYPVMAVASDGAGIRVYTWRSLSATNDVAPSATSQHVFGQTGASPSSAAIGLGSGNGDSMVLFTGFTKVGASSIVASQFQSGLVLPGLNSAEALTYSSGSQMLSLQSLTPDVTGLTGSPTVTWFNCAATFVGSNRLASEATAPAGCTVYDAAAGAKFFDSNNNRRLDLSQSGSSAVGHVLARFSYSNPTFNYYTPSVEVTSAMVPSSNSGSSGGSSGGSGSISAPTPAPRNLAGGGGAGARINSGNQSQIESARGEAMAGTVSSGTVTAVSATVTRVSATTVADIRVQAQAMVATFAGKWDGTGTNSLPKVSVVNSAGGALIFGLIANPTTLRPIGVPAQDVLMVSTSDQAVMLAAAKGDVPSKVNSSGVLVVNDGGLLGAAANGFAANTAGELVLMSTPTLLGTFTTDSNGSFAGQALIPAGFQVGDHTAVLVTDGAVTSMGVTVEPAAVSGGATFNGPIVTDSSSAKLKAGVAAKVIWRGTRLSSVTNLTVGSQNIPFTRESDGSLTVSLPALAAGVYDLKITYDEGSLLTQQAAFTVNPGGLTSSPTIPTSATRSLRFDNFVGDNYRLPNAAKVGIAKAVKAIGPVSRVVCRGYTSGSSVTAADRKLALRRAQEACALVRRVSPSAVVELRTSPAAGIGAKFRSVVVLLERKG